MKTIKNGGASSKIYGNNSYYSNPAYAGVIEEYGALSSTRTFASFQSPLNNRTFVDFESNTSVRSEFGRSDYDYFRPNEAVPRNIEETIKWSMEAYKHVGIINNVINLMGDFTSQGIKFVHPNRKIQKFYNTLAEKWKAEHISERFANTFYRCGTVVIHGLEGKITVAIKNKWSQTEGAVDIKVKEPDVESKTIPLRFVIYNPLSLEILNKGVLQFTDKPIFALKIGSLLKELNSGLNDEHRSQYYNTNIPSNFMEAVKNRQKLLPLDPDKVSAYYYKKDDWELWGTPIVAPILDDLVRLEKLNLADMAALDGAISQVRHWKVGNLDKNISPSAAGINKVRNLLSKNISGGVRELVTGPEIDFKESNTNVHQFLGSEKYQATLNAIYAGLGIPPTLTGVSTASGFTNNYISIKTLVERLEYGRTKLKEFWQEQLNKVAEAMGFKTPAKVVFDQMIMSDEATEKALLLQLIDRDIISLESVRGRLDFDDEIERLRIDREYTERKEAAEGPQKAGPFHNPQQQHEYKKLLLSGGDVTPSQMGFNLPDKKPGEKTRLEKQMEMKKYAPPGQNGRPKTKKDSTKRKQKTVKPRTSAEMFVWTAAAYNKIGEITTNVFLSMLDKKNVRMLSVAQTSQLESLKADVLDNITPFTTITEDLVYNILEKQPSVSVVFTNIFKEIYNSFVTSNKRKPSTEELRNITVASYVEAKSI